MRACVRVYVCMYVCMYAYICATHPDILVDAMFTSTCISINFSVRKWQWGIYFALIQNSICLTLFWIFSITKHV
jgi:hypothetical protein